MPSEAALRGTEEALERLFRLGANRRFDARQTAAVGAAVTRAGYAVLRCLRTDGPTSIGVLASECAMDAAAASRQIDRLEADRLVARRASPADARAVEVAMTVRGGEVYDAVVAHRVAFLGDALATWTDDELATLESVVRRLVEDLDVRSPGPPGRKRVSPGIRQS